MRKLISQPSTSDEGTPTKTPLTDAQVIQASELCYSQVVVAKFARQLEITLHAKERELAAARSDRDDWMLKATYRDESVSAAPPSGYVQVPQKVDAVALEFEQWFVKNYPGPDTIIHNPLWHVPKIYRAAVRAHINMCAATPTPSDSKPGEGKCQDQ